MTDDIVSRFIEIVAAVVPSVSETDRKAIEKHIRQEYAGERLYIRKIEANRDESILQKFNGNNVRRLAKEMEISRRTVYRAIKKQRST